MRLGRARVVGVTPLIVVANLNRSIDFYQNKLGFREPSLWGQPPCFAMLNRDHFDVMLSLAESPEMVRPNGRQRIWDMYFKVNDISAEMAALEAAGVPLDRGPERTEYHIIEIEVIDPDGYRICIGQEVR